MKAAKATKAAKPVKKEKKTPGSAGKTQRDRSMKKAAEVKKAEKKPAATSKTQKERSMKKATEVKKTEKKTPASANKTQKGQSMKKAEVKKKTPAATSKTQKERSMKKATEVKKTEKKTPASASKTQKERSMKKKAEVKKLGKKTPALANKTQKERSMKKATEVKKSDKKTPSSASKTPKERSMKKAAEVKKEEKNPRSREASASKTQKDRSMKKVTEVTKEREKKSPAREVSASKKPVDQNVTEVEKEKEKEDMLPPSIMLFHPPPSPKRSVNVEGLVRLFRTLDAQIFSADEIRRQLCVYDAETKSECMKKAGIELSLDNLKHLLTVGRGLLSYAWTPPSKDGGAPMLRLMRVLEANSNSFEFRAHKIRKALEIYDGRWDVHLDEALRYKAEKKAKLALATDNPVVGFPSPRTVARRFQFGQVGQSMLTPRTKQVRRLSVARDKERTSVEHERKKQEFREQKEQEYALEAQLHFANLILAVYPNLARKGPVGFKNLVTDLTKASPYGNSLEEVAKFVNGLTNTFPDWLQVKEFKEHSKKLFLVVLNRNVPIENIAAKLNEKRAALLQNF